MKPKSDIQLALEHQTNAIIKELESIRTHIFFKLETAHGDDRETLQNYENKVLTALNAIEGR